MIFHNIYMECAIFAHIERAENDKFQVGVGK